jgi:hypothetical protein
VYNEYILTKMEKISSLIKNKQNKKLDSPKTKRPESRRELFGKRKGTRYRGQEGTREGNGE